MLMRHWLQGLFPSWQFSGLPSASRRRSDRAGLQVWQAIEFLEDRTLLSSVTPGDSFDTAGDLGTGDLQFEGTIDAFDAQFFQWTADTDGLVNVTLTSPTTGADLLMEVFTSDQRFLASGGFADGNVVPITGPVTSGSTYFLVLDEFAEIETDYTLSISTDPAGITDLGTGDVDFDGTIGPFEDQWFRWTADADGLATVILTSPTAGADLETEIFTSNMFFLDFGDFAEGAPIPAETPVEAGRSYFLWVGEFAQMQSSFNLSVSTDPDGVIDLGTGDTQIDGVIEAEGRQWFQWTPGTTGVATLTVASQTPGADLTIEAFNFALGESFVGFGEFVDGTAHPANVLAFEGQTYHIVLDEWAGIESDVVLSLATDPAAIVDLGTLAGPQPPMEHSIDEPGIDDAFRFETLAAGTAGDFVRIDFNHDEGNLDMELFDAEGTWIAGSFTAENFEEISLAGLPAGSYVLLVYGIAGATNDYTLTINAPTAVDVEEDGIVLFDDSTGRWNVGHNVGGRFQQQLSHLWNPDVTWDFHEGDFTGNGLLDVAGRHVETGDWWVFSSTVGGFATTHWGRWAPDAAAGWSDVLVGDFNGDGRDDVVGRTADGQLWVAQSAGNRFVNTFHGDWSASGWASTEWSHVVVGDFNGDGRDGIAGMRDTGHWFFAQTNGGDRFTTTLVGSWSGTADWQHVMAADFTGDGRSDVIGQTAAGQWWIGASQATSLNTFFAGAWSTEAGFDDVHIGDFDGDGMADLASRTSGGDWFVLRSNGLGERMTNERWGRWSGTAEWTTIVGDFTGNGRDDIAGYEANSGQVWVAASTGGSFENRFYGQWDPLNSVGFAASGVLGGA